VHDPATGAVRSTFAYQAKAGQTPLVSDIRVSDDLIVVAVAFDKVRSIEKGLWDSTMLVALDRKTGAQLWTREAAERFNNHALAIGDGAVFCIDSMSGAETEKLKRRGEIPESASSTILALESRTGQERWSMVTTNPFKTYTTGQWLGMRINDDWLAFCDELDLVLAGKSNQLHGIDTRTGNEVWQRTIGGGQPLILQGTSFINQAGHTYDTRTGELLNGESAFARGGCNYAVAGESLIFVRDRSVCYVEKATGEKHYLRNIRSGCSNSLVAADGLLNAPCFSVKCVCNYPIQTSFAMLHMPEVAGWAEPSPVEPAKPAD
jgi:outer membrane protein assembly factor BamB